MDESVDADTIRSASGESVDTGALEELMQSQRSQYVGLRKSMQRLDEKLSEMDERMETMANHNDPLHQSNELENIHSAWRDKIIPIVDVTAKLLSSALTQKSVLA